MKKILQALKQHGAERRQAIAISSGETCLNYSELARRVSAMAAQLQRQPVKRMGLFLDNGMDWIVADLACAEAGITVVPLPWFFSQQQLQHATHDGELQALLCSQNETLQDLPVKSSVVLNHSLKLVLLDSKHHDDTSGDIAKQSYTSGTTGQPKGIALPGELIESVAISLADQTKDLAVETHLSLLPYATLLENIGGIYVPLLQGKTILAEPAEQLGLSADLSMKPAQLAALLRQRRPQSLIATPQLLKLLCHLIETGQFNGSCLRFVAVGGARVGEALLAKSRRLGLPVYEGYGLTEAASVALLNTPEARRTGSVGKALPHVEPSIAEDGELILHFPTLDLEPVATGDLAYCDADGFFHITGRKKNVLVLSTGRNVSPEWIEGELNGSDLIAQSFVFGEAQTQVSALIVPVHPTVTDSQIDLAIEAMNQTLPAYAQLAHWRRLSQPFSTRTNTLTSNGRPRREQILQQLDQLCATGHAA